MNEIYIYFKWTKESPLEVDFFSWNFFFSFLIKFSDEVINFKLKLCVFKYFWDLKNFFAQERKKITFHLQI